MSFMVIHVICYQYCLKFMPFMSFVMAHGTFLHIQLSGRGRVKYVFQAFGNSFAVRPKAKTYFLFLRSEKSSLCPNF
jgi:hypothetical protein